MSVLMHLWTTPKPDAESVRENEDRFWVSGYRQGESFVRPVNVALTDGASEGLFTREWARELARTAAQNRPRTRGELADVLSSAADIWNAQTSAVRLPWFLEARRAQPAAAALLILEIRPERAWSALAVGDTCLFQVRADQGVICSFPLARITDFGTTPALISVEVGKDVRSVRIPQPNRVEGDWKAGDTFYIMTDALAAWFIQEAESGRAPWRWLDDVRDDADFRNRIRTLRESGRLRGDDTTLVHVKMGEPETCFGDSNGALA